MEVIIKGEAKEIAALVLAVQEQQEKATFQFDVEKFERELLRQLKDPSRFENL